MISKTATSLLALALVGGCGSQLPTMRAGYVPENVQDIRDPVMAIAQRLQRAGPLLVATASEGDAGREASRHLLALTREIAAMMGDPVFDQWPVTRARIRTRILFLMDDDAKTRADALDECREDFAKLRAKIGRKRGQP